MSAPGQKQKSSVGLGMSAFGGEADEIKAKADIKPIGPRAARPAVIRRI